MSESTDRPAVETSPPAASPMAPPADAESARARSVREYVESLKQRLPKTQLPTELRDELLADMPPPKEMERLYKELQENGGVSFEEIYALIGLDVEQLP